MPTPQTSINSAAANTSDAALRSDPAEDRTFPTEGAEALAGEVPAELLMDDVSSRAGLGDGSGAKLRNGLDTGPLKTAANDLAIAVGDVLKGKAARPDRWPRTPMIRSRETPPSR